MGAVFHPGTILKYLSVPEIEQYTSIQIDDIFTVKWKLYIAAIYLFFSRHYSDITIGDIASQITSVSIVYSTVSSGVHKKSKLRVTGLCEGNSPVTGEFPAQRASNAENVSTWWRHLGNVAETTTLQH